MCYEDNPFWPKLSLSHRIRGWKQRRRYIVYGFMISHLGETVADIFLNAMAAAQKMQVALSR